MAYRRVCHNIFNILLNHCNKGNINCINCCKDCNQWGPVGCTLWKEVYSYTDKRISSKLHYYSCENHTYCCWSCRVSVWCPPVKREYRNQNSKANHHEQKCKLLKISIIVNNCKLCYIKSVYSRCISCININCYN